MRSARLILLTVIFSAGLSYGQGPQITSTTPASGVIGTSVQINGSGFGATQGTSTVAFNGVNATAASWSDAQITATVPSVATGPVTVKVNGTTSNANVYFTVPPPQVTGISPNAGGVGTQVTITGSGFGPTQGSSCVAFNTNCVTVSSWSATQIVASVSSNSGSGPTIVTVNGVGSNKDWLFTVPNPLVTGLSPSSGTTGTQVTVSGSGFGSTQGSSTITFNRTNPTIVSWSDTQILATVPATATTGPVVVTTGGFASN